MFYWFQKRKNNAIVIIALCLLILSACSTGSDISFTARPANIYNDGSWILYEMQPGQSIEDEIIIFNYENEPRTFSLLGVDSTTTTSGDFALFDNDSTENIYMNEWVVFEDDLVTLEPNEIATIPFKFILPEDVEYGEYSGGIAVTPTSTDVVDASGTAVFTRIGLRIYLTVTDDPQPVEVEFKPYMVYTVFYWAAGIISALTFLALMYVIFVMKEE